MSTQPWKRLLYIKQCYPDNYVDDSFLELMQKNVNVREHHYWTVVLRTCAVTQHISSIVVFLGVFIRLYTESLPPHHLLVMNAAYVLAGYVAWELVVSRLYCHHNIQRWNILKGSTTILAILVGLTPILKTLTREISSDTIWALTVIMFLANLIFHDYESQDVVKIRFPDSLSINAGIFASVLLASRLPSNAHVLSLMLFAITVYVLVPIFRRLCRSVSPMYDIIVLATLAGASIALFLPISHEVVTLYLIAIFFVNLVCPYWLIHAQKYKSEIRGPWDEARIMSNSSDPSNSSIDNTF